MLKNRIVLKDEKGICGVYRQKGLFINYLHNEFGTIQLEFFKTSKDGKYYYLVDNMNFSYLHGKSHNDIMIIHNKVEKLIFEILNNNASFEKLEELKDKLFNFKKYKDDEIDLKDLMNIIIDNLPSLQKYLLDNEFVF